MRGGFGVGRAGDGAFAGELAGAARSVSGGRGVGRPRAGQRSAVDAAASAEHDARSTLAQKKADRDVVAKDEARFNDARRRDQEAREEEAAEEAWGGGRKDR